MPQQGSEARSNRTISPAHEKLILNQCTGGWQIEFVRKARPRRDSLRQRLPSESVRQELHRAWPGDRRMGTLPESSLSSMQVSGRRMGGACPDSSNLPRRTTALFRPSGNLQLGAVLQELHVIVVAAIGKLEKRSRHWFGGSIRLEFRSQGAACRCASSGAANSTWSASKRRHAS